MSSAQVYVVAGVVLTRDGKILLVQEKKPQAYGKWNLPAGHVDEGETIEAAAVREAKEETGFDVVLDRALPVIHSAIAKPVLHAFAAHITGGELNFPPDELLGAQWFTPAQVRSMTSSLRSPDYIIGSLDALKND